MISELKNVESFLTHANDNREQTIEILKAFKQTFRLEQDLLDKFWTVFGIDGVEECRWKRAIGTSRHVTKHLLMSWQSITMGFNVIFGKSFFLIKADVMIYDIRDEDTSPQGLFGCLEKFIRSKKDAATKSEKLILSFWNISWKVKVWNFAFSNQFYCVWRHPKTWTQCRVWTPSLYGVAFS